MDKQVLLVRREDDEGMTKIGLFSMIIHLTMLSREIKGDDDRAAVLRAVGVLTRKVLAAR